MRRQFKIPTLEVIDTIRGERGVDIPKSVVNAIESERDYQDSKWHPNAPVTEGVHTFAEWCVYIEDYIKEGQAQVRSVEIAKASCTMRKIVAMAVEALEQHGVPNASDLKFGLSLDQGHQSLEWWLDTLQAIINMCKHSLTRGDDQLVGPMVAIQFVRIASYGVAAMEQHGVYPRE